jgi:hypothetical protein
MWSELYSKSGPICLQKLVWVVFKTIVGNPWVTDDASKHAPSCLYKVVRTDLKVAKNVSDFTLNNGPSCPGKVVRADLKSGLILH